MNAFLDKLSVYFSSLFAQNPVKFLVRKIDPSNLDQAFAQENQEFYGDAHGESGMGQEFYEQIWNPFIQRMEVSDELWFYRLPDRFWEKSMGHQGYVIIRNGKSVAKVVTKRN